MEPPPASGTGLPGDPNPSNTNTNKHTHAKTLPRSRSKTSKTQNQKADIFTGSSSFRNGCPADLSGWWTVRTNTNLPKLSSTKHFLTLKGCMLNQYTDESCRKQVSRHCLFGSEISFSIQTLTMFFHALDLRLTGTDLDEFLQWATTIREMSKRRIENFYRMGDLITSTASFWDNSKLASSKLQTKSYIVRGDDIASGETVAIKIIVRSACSPREMQFVEREAAILMMVNHPAIVETYDIFDSDDNLYIVMKYMDGGDLATILAQQTCFGEKQALEIFRSILCAVASVHRQGIVHRDIRPATILCGSRAWPLKPRLGEFEFGIVVAMEKLRRVEDRQAQNQTRFAGPGSPDPQQKGSASFRLSPTSVNDELSEYVGTWAYMSPEQVNRESYGRPVDMWALGVTLYELISGKLPFEGETIVDTLRSISEDPVVFGPRFYGTSNQAKALISALLEKDPTKRMTAEEALKNLWVNPTGSDDRWLVDGLEGLQTGVSLIKRIMAYGKRGGQGSGVPMLSWHSKDDEAVSHKKAESESSQESDFSEFVPFVTPKLFSVDSFASERSDSSTASTSASTEPLVFGKASRHQSRDYRETAGSPRFASSIFPEMLVFGVDVDRKGDPEKKKPNILVVLGEKGGNARAPVFGAGVYSSEK